MKKNKIAVIGLGYVGLTFAISLARVGFEVLGIEDNEKIFKPMVKGKAQFYEENIDKFLIKMQQSGKLKIQNNLENIEKYNIIFITIGTPVDDNKNNIIINRSSNRNKNNIIFLLRLELLLMIIKILI